MGNVSTIHLKEYILIDANQFEIISAHDRKRYPIQ